MWLQTQIWHNRFKSLYLLILMPTLVFLWILISFFITYGRLDNYIMNQVYLSMSIAIPIVLIWLFIAILFQRHIIFKFSWAKPITRKENPEIYNIVENLCISRWLPMPKVGIIEDSWLNAFATGWNPNNSWIVFTRWILEVLDKNEIEAVIWHELSHIINWDIKVMVLANVFVGIIWTIWSILMRSGYSSKWDSKNKNILPLIWLVLYILSIVILPLINLAISRSREYLADRWSVELTKDKYAMISALQKISGNSYVDSMTGSISKMWIANPLKKIQKLFSTHPWIEDRIKALENF